MVNPTSLLQPRTDWTKPEFPPGDNTKLCTVFCLWDLFITIDGKVESSITNKGQPTPFFDSNISSTRPIRWEFTITQTNFPSARSGSVHNNPGIITHLNYSGRNSSNLRVSCLSIERSDESEFYSYQYVGFIAYGLENEVYRFVESNYRNDEGLTVTGRYAIFRTYPNIVYSSCGYPPTPAPVLPNLIYLGTAAPPPPPPKNMNCCSCNTIASILESQLVQRDKLFENLKDHIDQRIKEEITIHGKQLESLEVDLQPVIDRINLAENNLWNGPKQ